MSTLEFVYREALLRGLALGKYLGAREAFAELGISRMPPHSAREQMKAASPLWQRWEDDPAVLEEILKLRNKVRR